MTIPPPKIHILLTLLCIVICFCPIQLHIYKDRQNQNYKTVLLHSHQPCYCVCCLQGGVQLNVVPDKLLASRYNQTSLNNESIANEILYLTNGTWIP